MPRGARILDPSGVYHVICRGNNKKMIFLDDRDRLAYVSIVRSAKAQFPFQLMHYVIMGNHVHLLLRLFPRSPLSHIMKRISQSYAEYFRRRYEHVGHLWQNRYKSIAVTDDAYLLTCGMYIEMNPVRANMVVSPAEYSWSSYRHYAFGMKNDLLDDDLLYSTLGNNDQQRQATYQRLCLGTVPQGTVPGG